MELQRDLENVLKNAGLTVLPRIENRGYTPSDQTGRAFVLWAGAGDQRMLAFTVYIVVAPGHGLHADFLKAWNAVKDSDVFVSQPDVAITYDGSPPSMDAVVDFVSFTVLANRTIDFS